MNVLMFGGTGTISGAVARRAIALGHTLTILNRGNRPGALPDGAESLVGDANDAAGLAALLGDRTFDVVFQPLIYTPDQISRDVGLFSGRCGQYVFISSASAYAKPVPSLPITEETPLDNPFWQYSRDKAACEEALGRAAEDGFPVTIVRPSHTYAERSIPVAFHGPSGSWTVIKRIIEGRPVVVHGDGESLWTFTWADDFATGCAGLFGLPAALGTTVHITADESITWNNAYRHIAHAVGGRLELVHVTSDELVRRDPALEGPLLGDKANSVIFDNTLIKSLVPEFATPTGWAEGVVRCWDSLQHRIGEQKVDAAFDAFLDELVADRT